jgi:hypothetical protein
MEVSLLHPVFLKDKFTYYILSYATKSGDSFFYATCYLTSHATHGLTLSIYPEVFISTTFPCLLFLPYHYPYQLLFAHALVFKLAIMQIDWDVWSRSDFILSIGERCSANYVWLVSFKFGLWPNLLHTPPGYLSRFCWLNKQPPPLVLSNILLHVSLLLL